MSKVIILGGNARSGKSTLSFELVKHGYSRISFDNLYNALEDSFNFNMDEIEDKIKFNLFENIVNKSLDEAINENTNIVIDMYDFLPGDINKLKRKNEVEVYFLAYPDCTETEIKYNVKHYAKPTDWIAQVNEDYLSSCAKRFYERNKMLVEECNKYNMTLINTGAGEERKKILQKLLNRIINN